MKINKFWFLFGFLFIFVFLFFSQPVKAQKYLWPTDASRFINSTFGEFRPGHFHSGIDIKTWEKEGYRVFAVRDGFVYRVRVSPFGYGKALYLKLDTGEFAVYGHLQRFAPKIERIIKSLQRKHKRYSVEKYFRRDQIPVKKGEVIAFSGRTGIGAPHLHFEIRDRNNNPINPLLKYPSFKDRVRPQITGLAVVPFGKYSQVNGDPLPKTFSVQPGKKNFYYLNYPIQVWGDFGLAVSGFDRSARIRNKCAFYRLILLVDGNSVFRAEYDSLSFEKTKKIIFDRNFRLMQWTGRHYNNLFLLPENNLPFYYPDYPGTGIFTTLNGTELLRSGSSILAGKSDLLQPTLIQPGKHSFKIVAEDFSKNKATLIGTLLVGKKRHSKIEFKPLETGVQLINNSNEKIMAARFNGQKWQALSLQLADLDSLNSNYSIEIPVNPATHWLKFWTISDLGFNNYPVFAPTISAISDSLTINKIEYLKNTFMDDFVEVHLHVSKPTAQPLQLNYNTGFSTDSIHLRQIGLNDFTAVIPLDSIANAFTLLSVQMASHSNRFPVDFIKTFKIDPNQERDISLSRDGTHIRFLKNSAYQPIYFRFEKFPLSRAFRVDQADSITYLLQLDPTDIPLRKGAVLSMHVPNKEKNIEKLAIYSASQRKWVFQGNKFDFNYRAIEVHLRNFGKFTILRDTLAPRILRLIPHQGQTVTSRMPTIRVYFRDDLSGIEDDRAVKIYLDGKFRISEYDPEMNRTTFVPDWKLKSGIHSVKVEITDRCGNTSRRIWHFYVRSAK